MRPYPKTSLPPFPSLLFFLNRKEPEIKEYFWGKRKYPIPNQVFYGKDSDPALALCHSAAGDRPGSGERICIMNTSETRTSTSFWQMTLRPVGVHPYPQRRKISSSNFTFPSPQNLFQHGVAAIAG
jgi:hypothetical protein